MVERQLLNQLQVVAEGVEYPLFINEKIVCYFTVGMFFLLPGFVLTIEN